MAMFDYNAINKEGENVKGRIDAKKAEDVKKQLGNKGYRNIQVKENRLAMNIVIGSGVKDKELVMFYRQMSNLIETGVSLSRGLSLLAEQTKNKHFQGVLVQINEDIKVGVTLSKSMEKFPKIFPETTTFQIRAAEEGGFLQKTMKELAIQIRRENDFKKKVKGALIYPIIVLMLTIGVVAFLMLFIVPKISEALVSMDADMPGITQMLINVSEFAKDNAIGIMLFILAIVVIFIVLYKKIFAFRMKVDIFMLKLPLFGVFIMNMNLARIVRNMSSLMESGVGIEQTMQNIKKIIKNEKMREMMEEIQEEMLTKGIMMSKAFENRKYFPSTLIQVMSIGEETGKLPETLQQLADQYEEEVTESVTNIVNIVNPALMIIIAVMVGIVVIGMFSPMFSMMEGISNK